MFGCDAFFASGEIYGLIWKTGRIGLKFTDSGAFDELMARPGSEPWKAGPKVMSHWVLVPEEFHDAPDELAKWVRRAHSLAMSAGSMSKPSPRKPVAKKTASKKTARKATSGNQD